VYREPDCAGKTVVILGGGLVGLELAVYLGTLDRQVTVVEMQSQPNLNGNVILGQALQTQLDRLGIQLHFQTQAVQVTSEGLVAQTEHGRHTFPADTVICAAGMRPLTDVVRSLLPCAPQVHFLGDCRAPRTIADATREAYFIARDIGVTR
ncbi:MAG: FAD-dependent oxidoreductase, partial [Oscillospiraceae bacterium]|nr:FAD-dependent oxidoreductase [Oscillospiraceae bacterium]